MEISSASWRCCFSRKASATDRGAPLLLVVHPERLVSLNRDASIHAKAEATVHQWSRWFCAWNVMTEHR
jgi:hypothetical protein